MDLTPEENAELVACRLMGLPTDIASLESIDGHLRMPSRGYRAIGANEDRDEADIIGACISVGADYFPTTLHFKGEDITRQGVIVSLKDYRRVRRELKRIKESLRSTWVTEFEGGRCEYTAYGKGGEKKKGPKP